MDNETFVAELVALRTLVVAMYSLHTDRQLIAERFKLFHSQFLSSLAPQDCLAEKYQAAHKNLLDQISSQGFSL